MSALDITNKRFGMTPQHAMNSYIREGDDGDDGGITYL